MLRTTRTGWTPMPDEARTDRADRMARSDRSMRIRQVPNWQVLSNGVMSLPGASWGVQAGLAPIGWDA